MQRGCSTNGTGANKHPANGCHEGPNVAEFPAVAASCKPSGNILPAPDWFGPVARSIWKLKVAAHLQVHLPSKSERTLRAWASSDSEPPSSVLVALLRTDDGGAILDWIMSDFESVAWWKIRRRDRAIAEFHDRQRGEAKRLGIDL